MSKIIKAIFMVYVLINKNGKVLAAKDYSKVNFCNLNCKFGSEEFPNSSCDCPKLDKNRCGSDYRMIKFSENPKHPIYMVKLHNIYRDKLASGDDRRGGNIGATDMMALEYDLGLEYTAWCWSHNCLDDHDQCRITPEFDTAGQNQYMWFDNQPCDESTMEDAVDKWYEEISINKRGRKCIKNFDCDLHGVGHWTQLVWASTTHVGCAFSKYLHARTRTITCNIFCNYGPAGNWQGSRVYTLGRSARDCKQTHPEYSSLCIGDLPISGNHEAGATIIKLQRFLFFGIILIIY
nr:venom allergen 3-like [Onthophagus taurus]